MTTPQHKTLAHRVIEINNFGRLFLGHHYYNHLCLSEEKMILTEIMHFHYMNYLATPLHKNSRPGGHKILNIGEPFRLSDLYLGVEK